jgi:DNA-directed RNA polymerase specialized sigma24 family protein
VLHELSPAHREVIVLRDFAGCDWRTVAERMERPSAEACQELHRRARRELEQRYFLKS